MEHTCHKCSYRGASIYYRCKGCGLVVCSSCFKGYKCANCPHGHFEHL